MYEELANKAASSGFDSVGDLIRTVLSDYLDRTRHGEINAQILAEIKRKRACGPVKYDPEIHELVTDGFGRTWIFEKDREDHIE
jgi:hypothetical protein